MISKKLDIGLTGSGFNKFTSFKFFHEITIFAVMIVLATIIAIMEPGFLKISNILNVLNQVSVTTILALGLGIVLISGGIDLSISSILVLTGVPVIFIIEALNGSLPSVILAIIGGILFGAAIGFINGINIVFLKITAFIATLAMMLITQGSIKTILGGTSAGDLAIIPKGFIAIGTGSIGGIPYTMIIILVLFIYMTERTPFGRSIYFIGGSEETARTHGIKVKKVKVMIYVISGICGGIAGVIFTARHASAQPLAENPYLFDAITAAVLGGVSMSGGSGTMIGIFLGSLVVGIINNGQDLMGVNPYIRWIVTGLIIIFAIVISSLSRKEQQ